MAAICGAAIPIIVFGEITSNVALTRAGRENEEPVDTLILDAFEWSWIVFTTIGFVTGLVALLSRKRSIGKRSLVCAWFGFVISSSSLTYLVWWYLSQA
jgi:uncharacterized BrkB/YihY/UPF0761 family membrane protein